MVSFQIDGDRVTRDLARLPVDIESVEDLIEVLERALCSS